MKKRMQALAVAVIVATSPVNAQEESPPSNQFEEGFDMLELGTRLLLESLIDELGPAWEELRMLMNEVNAFHPPEILPNGDIIIRRKVPLVPENLDEDTTEL